MKKTEEIKEKKIKAWILCHHGMGTGVFQIYRTKRVAETAFIEKQCECTEKPVSCVITYTPKYLV